MSTILIIDDDSQLRGLIRRILQREGHEIREAVDGEAGLRACDEAVPDMVLTDIVMPNKEGIETIVDLRKRFPDLPVVAMSGGSRFGSDAYLEIAHRLGACETLLKPFQTEELLRVVRESLAARTG